MASVSGMEADRGMRSPGSCSIQFHWFTPYLLAICFAVVPLAGRAATYWQLQQSTATVIVEGDQNAAKSAAETILGLQAAARSLLSWPDSYHEPPVLAFVVNERLLRRNFRFPPEPPGVYADATARHGTWGRTPSLTVIAAAMGYERGREFRSLQRVYGEALVDAEPSHDWPACAQVGMTMVFTSAELTPPNHFYLAGTTVTRREHFWNPEEILSLSEGRAAQWLTDERGYSCYLLSFMIASAIPEERLALEKVLTSVGRGIPLSTVTMAELHQTLPEFTARYGEFARAMRSSPELHQIRVELPELIPSMPEPSALSSARVQALMEKLCAKLQNCRK
jgi:hypothetical protein